MPVFCSSQPHRPTWVRRLIRDGAHVTDATAKQYGVNVHDEKSSGRGAANKLYDDLGALGGDLDKALAAYNSGLKRVQDAAAKWGQDWLKHLPQETQNYVPQVKARLAHEQQRAAGAIRVVIENNTGGSATASAAQVAH